MAFYNQGSRPAYLSSLEPISFRTRSIDLDKIHGQFARKAVTFLSGIRAEDLNQPRVLWEKVFDDGARERFVQNVAGHIANVRGEEIIKRQVGIFREVSEDLALKLKKATGIKGYPGIAGLRFNGCHNGVAKESSGFEAANGMEGQDSRSAAHNNGAPMVSDLSL